MSKTIRIITTSLFMVVFFFGSGAAPAHAALSAVQVNAVMSFLQSFNASQSVITNVERALVGGTVSGGTVSSGGVASGSFTASMSTGSQSDNPVPTLVSISSLPSPLKSKSGDLTFTLNGTNFISGIPTGDEVGQKYVAGTGSQVYIDAEGAGTEFVNSTELTVRTLNSQNVYLAPGTHVIKVVNPAPGGGTSNMLTFVVADAEIIRLGFPADLRAEANANIVVPVTVSDLAPVEAGGGSLSIEFDPAVITLTGASTVGTIAAGYFSGAYSPASGKLNVAFFGDPPLTGSGTLLNLLGRAVANGTSQLHWGSRSSFVKGDLVVTDGTFTVGPVTVAVTSVSLNESTRTLTVGNTDQLTATVLPSNATNKAVTYSSNNTSVATVSATGLISAVSAGTAVITVTTVDGAKTATDTITVVNPVIHVTSVSTSDENQNHTLTVGNTYDLGSKIIVLPLNATDKTVTYSSANPSIATVNSTTGLVTAIAPGFSYITITTRDGGKTAQYLIAIRPVQHNLTYLTDSNGSIPNINRTQIVNDDDNGEPVLAIANTGYHFVSWSDGSTANPRTDTNIKGDITVTASFAANPTYTITVTQSANGTIIPSTQTNITSGTNQTFTITPASGYRIVSVSVDGVSVGAVASYTFSNITTNHTIAAFFAVTITSTNGACSVPAVHYTCSSPAASTNPASGSSAYTWTCPGTNGGTNALCSEPKPAPTASLSVSPTSVAYGSPATLSWSSTNATSCTTSTNWTTGGALTGSKQTAALTANTTYTLRCSGNGQTTAVQSVTVAVGPAPIMPTITSITPASAPAGSAGLTLRVNGKNFVSGASTIYVNGVQIPLTHTNFISATQLTTVIPSSSLTTAGTLIITVVTTGPNGGTSNSQIFTVSPVTSSSIPTITSISPSSVAVGRGSRWLTIYGSKFIYYSLARVYFDGSQRYLANGSTAVNNNTQLTVVLNAADTATAGTHTITVVTSAGTSNAQTFTVANNNVYDYNNDRVIDSSDINTLTRVALGDAACPLGKTCDINGDGSVNIADIITLVNLTTIRVSPYDYYNDGTVGPTDVNFLAQVAIGNNICPSGKICDLDGNGGVNIADVLSLTNLILNNSGLYYDYTNDGKFDTADLNYLAAQMNQNVPTCPVNKSCDINSDGQLDITDVVYLAKLLNTASSTSAPTPVAPTTAVYSAPLVTAPVAGARIPLGGTLVVNAQQPSAGVGSVYLYAFVQDSNGDGVINSNDTTITHENYRDLRTLSGPSYSLDLSRSWTYGGKTYSFKPGLLNIGVRAYTNNQWTSGATVTVTLVNSTVLGNNSNQTASALNALSAAATKPPTSQPQVGAQTGFNYTWNRDLQIGSEYPNDITALQTALTREGLYAGEVTGGFYNQTYRAVRKFQKKYGIKTSGYVGALTRAKLNSLYSY